MRVVKRWQELAKRLETELRVVWLAYRSPGTPWYAKAMAVCVVAYAASPIDLIPDFIPILGYLDDLVLVPLGIWAVVRMVPPEVIAECRLQAQAAAQRNARGRWVAAAAIVVVWIGSLLLAVHLVLRLRA